MAIRDTAGKAPPAAATPPRAGAAPSAGGGSAAGPGRLPGQAERQLTDNNLVPPGQTPAQAAQVIVRGLVDRGFTAPQRAELVQQLIAVLKQMQSANQMPATGRIDPKTAELMQRLGVTPQQLGAPPPVPGKPSNRDGFERVTSQAQKKGDAARAEGVKAGSPDTNFLDALLNELGGPGIAVGEKGHSSGSSGVASSSAVDAGGAAGKGEGAQKKGVEAKDKKAEASALEQQNIDKGNAQGVKVARGLKSDSTKTEEQRRRDQLGTKDPTELGILDEEADDEATAGDGEGGKKRGRGGDATAGGEAEDGSTAGASGREAEDGSERDAGNAHSGDEDHSDKRRGHASIGDDDAGAGHYRVPSIHEQAFAALETIVRDVSEENRATTYSWSVLFLRPGVYAAGQKAQEIVRVTVEKATAFDAVWQKAQANIAILVRRFHGAEADAPSLDDIIAALRQARARDGDDTASGLHKVIRPIGKA